jgi:hypothetical protein
MKNLFAFIILSQLCFTTLSYVQDILDDLEFTENITNSNLIMFHPSPSPYPSPYPSPSPPPSPSPIPYIYNFVYHNELF